MKWPLLCSALQSEDSVPQPSSFNLPAEPTQALRVLPPTLHFPFLPTHRYCRCDSPVKALSPISVNLLELSNLERQRQS